MVDVETGLQPNADTKKIIYESFKPEDNFIVGLETTSDKHRLEFYDAENQRKIFKFY